MTRMLPSRSILIHDFKNQLGIVLGFSELLLVDLADTDPRKADLEEIHKAALSAMTLLAQLAASAPSEAVTAIPETEEQESVMPNASQPLVLVVDDEAPMRQMERRILEKGGFAVIEASGGADALAILKDGKPIDLLIADLDMPEVPGEEMVRQIRTARPDLKVLYVTAHIDQLLDVRAMLWKGEAFLDKPFTTKGLLEAVSLLLYGTLSGGPSQSRAPADRS